MKLLLTGIAVGAILEGISDGLILVDPQAFAQVRSWMVGSVDVAGFTPVAISALGLLIGLVCVLPHVGSINMLSMGDESAAALGVNVRRTRVMIVIAVTIMAATATATVGVFTFVGLVTPHIIRKLDFHSDRLVVLLSAVVGPTLILAADIAGRFLLDSELPASVVVAFISGPILIGLAQRGFTSEDLRYFWDDISIRGRHYFITRISMWSTDKAGGAAHNCRVSNIIFAHSSLCLGDICLGDIDGFWCWAKYSRSITCTHFASRRFA